MTNKIMTRPFFSDPSQSPDWNAGYAEGFQAGLEAAEQKEERKAAHQFLNSEQWLNLQAKLGKKDE